jgi:hypothetical protein
MKLIYNGLTAGFPMLKIIEEYDMQFVQVMLEIAAEEADKMNKDAKIKK